MNNRAILASRSAVLTFTLATLMLSGCLKTRAQLRGDDSDDRVDAKPGRPVPAQVQEVQPRGEYVIDELKSEITRMTGRIEDLERKSAQQDTNLHTAQREEIRKLQGRIDELERTQITMIETMKKMSTQHEQSRAEVDAPALFEKAKQQMASNDYEGAVESLNGYLKNSKVKHASDATLMRADAHFGMKQLKKAILDYNSYRERYPTSKKMPYVLNRIGLSFEGLGYKSDAQGFYQLLVEQYPKSSEAKKARAKLK